VKELQSVYNRRDYQLPDIVSYLQNETNLTRKAIVDILVKSEKLDDFPHNPQKFIEQVAAIVKHQMQLFIVDGIKYQKLGEDHYYAQELFEKNELFGYLKKNMIEAEKSVFDHVVYDSDVEAEFAKSFENNDHIKVYAKLPGWFTIDTPLGPYNPDWAVLVELDGEEKLYFVVETKGSLFTDALRPTEQAKIDCGREHFKALGNDVDFTVANTFDTFADKIFS
jgi:type III restriction enzyme